MVIPCGDPADLQRFQQLDAVVEVFSGDREGDGHNASFKIFSFSDLFNSCSHTVIFASPTKEAMPWVGAALHIGRTVGIRVVVLAQEHSLVHEMLGTDSCSDTLPTWEVIVHMFPCRRFFRLFSHLNSSFKKGRILQPARYGLLMILEINSSDVPDFVPAPAFPEDSGQCTQSLFWQFELP